MGFLRKLFGQKDKDPSNTPKLIKLYDASGSQIFVTASQWKDVLHKNLEKVKDNPDELYPMLVGSVQEDGLAADVVSYAEHLWQIDPKNSRSAIILAIIYMETGRLDDAEKVLNEFTATYGEDGVVLTNLAKVYSHQGDAARAEATLWHALELDPNQDNGLLWYAAIYRERSGVAAQQEAFQRVASLPTSWRAQLFLAKEALQNKDLATAESIYLETFEKLENPIPADLLMQISGDLGNNGYLAEIIRFVAPHFDSKDHGFKVGLNLIRAHHQLGQLEAARQVLNQLYALNRPDWRQVLDQWQKELSN